MVECGVVFLLTADKGCYGWLGRDRHCVCDGAGWRCNTLRCFGKAGAVSSISFRVGGAFGTKRAHPEPLDPVGHHHFCAQSVWFDSAHAKRRYAGCADCDRVAGRAGGHGAPAHRNAAEPDLGDPISRMRSDPQGFRCLLHSSYAAPDLGAVGIP